MTSDSQKRVLVIGAGFGGLKVATALRRSDVCVTLVDRQNYHLFQPLLYQVATGGLSPANIAAPVRSVLHRQKNVSVILGTATAIDVQQRQVEVVCGTPGQRARQSCRLPYDWLVIAAGSRTSYFGNDAWSEVAPGLKTIEDATRIRGRILAAFEAAEREAEASRRIPLMTFVVAGGGPTGVELAGAIAELARNTLRNDFRRIDPGDARIILVDGQDRVLSGFPEALSVKAQRSLERLGIELQTGTLVSDIQGDRVTLTSRTGQKEIRAQTVLWAAGVRGVPLAQQLAKATAIKLRSGDRIPVDAQCRIDGHSDIFVIGDIAYSVAPDGSPLPGVAPVAQQQGHYVGRMIDRLVQGKEAAEPFRYRDKGSMATIGRSAAVASIGSFRFSGYPAWLLWLIVHIMTLVQFQNRILVLIQWAWNYFTFNRSARLITHSRPDGGDGNTDETSAT